MKEVAPTWQHHHSVPFYVRCLRIVSSTGVETRSPANTPSPTEEDRPCDRHRGHVRQQRPGDDGAPASNQRDVRARTVRGRGASPHDACSGVLAAGGPLPIGGPLVGAVALAGIPMPVQTVPMVPLVGGDSPILRNPLTSHLTATAGLPSSPVQPARQRPAPQAQRATAFRFAV